MMSTKQLFVLGAGYVGQALLSRLKGHDYLLHASTTTPEKVEELKSLAQHVWLMRGSDKDQLRRIIAQCDAMIVLVAPSSREKYVETYLATAEAISGALKELEKPFYLLYTSSTSVYEGSSAVEWAREDLALQPASANARALLEAENIYLHCAPAQVNTCVLRLGGIYGPGRDLEKRARQFAGQEMTGTGLELTNHIHLQDILGAIEFCLKASLSGIYNLVNDAHPTRQVLYDGLCQKAGLPLPLWKAQMAAVKSGGYKVSNEKIRSAGYVFQLNAM